LCISTYLQGRRIRCRGCGTVLGVRLEPPAPGAKPRPVLCQVAAPRQTCPQCDGEFHLIAGLEGRRIRCKSCGQVIELAARRRRRRPAPAELPRAVAMPATERLALQPKPQAAAIVAPPEDPAAVEEETILKFVEGPEAPPRMPTAPEPAGALPNPSTPGSVSPQPSAIEPSPVEPAPVEAAQPEPALLQLPQAEPLEPIPVETAEPIVAETAPQPAAAPAVSPAPLWGEAPESRHGMSGAGHGSHSWVLALVAAGLLLCGAAAGGWWLVGGTPPCPQARYLPVQCDWFTSMNWASLPPDARLAAAKLPGLAIANRCGVFLENAGFQPEDIRRIRAGRAADGSGIVVVYELNRPVVPEQFMEREAFHSARKKEIDKETIRGVPVYHLRASSLAFPDAQTIVNGDTELLGQVLRHGGSALQEPIGRLVRAVEPAAMDVVVTAGPPRPLLEKFLPNRDYLAAAMLGSTEQVQFGPTLRLERTFHFENTAAAEEFRAALRTSLSTAARGSTMPEAVRKLLALAEISASENKVALRLSLPASWTDRLSPDVQDTLKQLF
jgi:hypothetical protein